MPWCCAFCVYSQNQLLDQHLLLPRTNFSEFPPKVHQVLQSLSHYYDFICLYIYTDILSIKNIKNSSNLSAVGTDYWVLFECPDEKYYKSSEVIKCKDGSKKFSRAQLNDDFCDCPDGTDEPGPHSFFLNLFILFL